MSGVTMSQLGRPDFPTSATCGCSLGTFSNQYGDDNDERTKQHVCTIFPRGNVPGLSTGSIKQKIQQQQYVHWHFEDINAYISVSPILTGHAPINITTLW